MRLPSRPIAIIGGGTTGCMTALMLGSVGLGRVTLFEADDQVLSGRATTLNSVGTNHHLAWSGDPETMEHFFKCAILFRQLMPDWVFSDFSLNYYVPGRTPAGQPNSAVDGVLPMGGSGPALRRDPRLSWRASVVRLDRLYHRWVEEEGGEAVFGPPGEYARELDEEDLRRMIGGPTPPGGADRWLVDDPEGGRFVAAVRLRQCVLNMAWFCVHLVTRLELMRARGALEILTGHRVSAIRPASDGFEVTAKSGGEQRRFRFHDVINAGYAGSVGIGLPGAADDGLHVALKVFGIYEPSPEVAESFASFIMIRGQFGSVVRAAPRLFSICSGREFDRDTSTLPAGPIAGRRLPERWSDVFNPKRRAALLGGSDAELLDLIQRDIAGWVPIVGDFRPVVLKVAPQLYPRQRPEADDVSAAVRRESELRDRWLNPEGGQYFRLQGAKMTTIPFAAVRATLALLEPHVAAGRLEEDEPAEHLRVRDGFIWTSPALRQMLGCGEDPVEPVVARRMIAARYKVPMRQLDP